ncbi:hypothetical protein EVAR_45530_1 [Eumeta japonica]|uniref:Uncharacterized protein n=1 Tax=Eumeta variegata TaxID=151549 RepID=A0A4C1X8I1_EUMVA|nr:hypothetical protein EVAR_45530_1 [Eumeta japonica]
MHGAVKRFPLISGKIITKPNSRVQGQCVGMRRKPEHICIRPETVFFSSGRTSVVDRAGAHLSRARGRRAPPAPAGTRCGCLSVTTSRVVDT